MTFNPAISFVDIYSREFHANKHKEVCTQSFSGALFVMAKTRQSITTTTTKPPNETKDRLAKVEGNNCDTLMQ